MNSLLFLGAVAFLVTLLLTPLLRDLFLRHNLVDRPDTGRKRHDQPVPRVGGVPVALGYVTANALLLLVGSPGAGLIREARPFALRLAPAAFIIFGVGLLDDLIGLRPWQKFAGQGVAAVAAYFGGISVTSFAGHEMAPWLSLPLTMFWLILCANAVNLIDGVDGLATGVGLFSTATMFLSGLLRNDSSLAIATAPLLGCLLGFLRYNFNPATIFLGDSGSLLVGFLLGCFGVVWSSKAATILGMTAPLMTLAIPLMDTGLAVVRRFLRGRPIFEGDRGHIHHRLLDRGMSPRAVALVLYGVCAAGALFSLVMASQRMEALVLVLFCGIAWIGVQHLGYIEFGVAGRMFVEGAFRRQLSAQISLQHFEKELEEARTADQCWAVIEPACREFEFQAGRARLLGGEFVFGEGPYERPGWELRISLYDGDYIELHRAGSQAGHATSVAPFADMLSRALALKYDKGGSLPAPMGDGKQRASYPQSIGKASGSAA